MKKLTRGVRQDELAIDQLEGSWRDAFNKVVYKAFKSVSNENGADDVTPTASLGYEAYPVNKKVIGVIVMNTERIHFFATTNPEDSEIGLVTVDNKYLPILRDAVGKIVLNFNENYPIQGAFEKRFNGDILIGWVDHDGVSSLNAPRILNINCLPFKTLSNYTVDPTELSKAQTLINLFPAYQTPIINPDNLETRDGQGSLLTGAYYPFFSYELADGTTTSYSKIYNGIPIYRDNMSLTFEKVGGDLGGVSSNKYIWFKAENIDTNYRYLNVGYIYSSNGIIKAYYVKKYSIVTSQLEVNLFGNESTQFEIDLDEVLVPNSTFKGAKSITTLQRQLYLANVEKEDEINYQTYANLIQVKWVREKDINIHGIVKSTKVGGTVTQYGSYKDAGLVFFDKSFKAGEVLAPFIVFKLKKGGYSKAFHIPGRAAVVGDKNVLNPTTTPSDLNDLDGGNPIYKYQVHDTSTALGVMGFWENENELYPLDPNNASAIHPDYANIPGISLTNRKVRHHVFPDLRALKGYGKSFVSGASTGKTMVIDSGTLNNPLNEEYYSIYDAVTSSVGSGFSFATNAKYTEFSSFSGPGIFTIGSTWFKDFSDNDTGSNFPGTTGFQLGGTGHYWLTWTIYKNGTIIRQYTADIGGVNPNPIFSSNFPDNNNSFSGFSVSVVPGDTISFEYFIQTPYSSGTVPNNSNPTDVGLVNADFGSTITVNFQTGSAGTQPLGIEVSNVVIPSAIAELVDSWEIFYAKRTESNIRIIAQDMIKNERFHNFDLLTNKLISSASYLKPLLDYGSPQKLDTVTSSVAETQYATQKIEYINNFLYVGENTTLPVNNAGKSESVYVVAGHAQTSPSYLQTNYGVNNTLFDICIYKRDTYFPLQIQDLVTTGLNVKVSSPGTQATKKIYGGDVYIISNGFRDDVTNNIAFYLACESVSNVHLRYEDLVNSKFYYPKNSNPTPSWYGYNRDYNCVNDYNKITIYSSEDNCSDQAVTKFPHRIPRSVTDTSEGRSVNWRIFKANDYYEMPKDKGVIWNVLGSNRTLYIHHEYSLFIAEIKDKIETGTGADIALGTSNVFDRPPVEARSTVEGYAGTQSQFAIVLCKFGYFFIDRQAGKVFHYVTGQGVREISNQGLYNYFKKYSQTDLENIDNPFIGRGYTMAYDAEMNRLILVKNEPEGESGYAFTWSYSPEANEGQGAWISRHGYKPHVIYSNRSGVFAVDNTQYKLFKHNSLTKKCIFYNGVKQRSYIDVVVNDSPELTKRFDNVNWISVSSSAGVNSQTESITNLIVYNDTQCSGDVDLKAEGGAWYGKDARNSEGTWNFNKFRDLVKNISLPFLDSKNEVISSNISTNKSWYDKSKFISKYVIFRLIHDNENQQDVHITAVGSNLKKSDR